MGVTWTAEQQQVIDLRNRNILVSAAAGSGKTAVLVERIIQMLTDLEHPMDVDRLLIVTFTDAAASEMRERIREAIERALEQDPSNAHLQRQSTLIHSAQITTIHSFCLSVIRENFHLIDMDPGFRIAEEGELKLLKQDVIEELLEQCYAEADAHFLELVEKLGAGKTDKKLEENILKLYEYSRSYPRPKKWLEECVHQYEMEDVTGEMQIFVMAENWVKETVPGLIQLVQEMMKICEGPAGPYTYCPMLEQDLAFLEGLEKCQSFAEMYEHLGTLKWKTLSNKKNESIDPELREVVKNLRNQMKGVVEELKKLYFYDDPAEIKADMVASKENMETLATLVLQFGELYTEKKQQKHLIDYEDMEQFALQILTEERDGELVPSMAAKEYQEQYYEVMIDEYQDSNLIQEAILTSVSSIDRGKYNIFMVGDVKQSIYRFRLSRPELFMEKYKTYTLTDSEKQRIDLHKNFRSRKEVLDGVNFFFKRIMRQELGGIEYDDQVALYPGASFEKLDDGAGHSMYTTEVMAVDKKASEEVEIRLIAKRIKELMRTIQVTDKETKQLRKPEYRDFVILLRSIKSWSELITTIFAEEGIPAYIGNSEGYFETYEISLLLDYLRLLDNQRQDLPLAAVLSSFLVGLSAQELADIRLKAGEGSFYEAVEEIAEVGITSSEHIEKKMEQRMSEATVEKLQKFYQQLEHFRELVPYTPIHDLLQLIIEETGYGIYVSAMPGGEQRSANVEMLVEKARAFEGTSYKGLFNFVRYIEQLQKYDVDYGEANVCGEAENTVRIMSIHKSKGLEFPIVFVAGMGKKFNTSDYTGNMLIHPVWGVGLDSVDLERRTTIPTYLKKTIQHETKIENLGEELRVLYVALTRAKEKLIMVGSAKWEDVELTEKEGTDEKLPLYILSSATNYMTWVLAALHGEAPIDVNFYEEEALTDLAYMEEKAEYLARNVLENWSCDNQYDARLREHLDTQFGYQYPYLEEQNLKMKFTVSELKKRAYLQEESGEVAYEEPEVVPLIPQFLQEETTLTGASRGSAYHKLLELLDFQKEYDPQSLAETIRNLAEQGLLSEEMEKSIRSVDILQFLNCTCGKRMTQAARKGMLFKEQPFVLGVPAVEIYPETTSDETILVQGIIDVYFEEDGELVLLDYKTDYVKNAQELRERYHAQLEYYAQALEQLLQKKVKEKIIYSFALKEEIWI